MAAAEKLGSATRRFWRLRFGDGLRRRPSSRVCVIVPAMSTVGGLVVTSNSHRRRAKTLPMRALVAAMIHITFSSRATFGRGPCPVPTTRQERTSSRTTVSCSGAAPAAPSRPTPG
jgi:hypothetical protein